MQSSSCGTVGLSEDERHVVPRGEYRFERAGGEGRRAREDDAQGLGARNQAALRWRFFSFARTRFCFRSER